MATYSPDKLFLRAQTVHIGVTGSTGAVEVLSNSVTFLGSSVGITGTLEVGDTAAFASTVTVGGALGVTGSLSVGQGVSLESTLGVSGQATFKSSVGVSGTLEVGGDATFESNVHLTSGDITFDAGLNSLSSVKDINDVVEKLCQYLLKKSAADFKNGIV